MIVAASSEGISDRIQALIIALRYNRDARIYWPVNKLVNCKFSDLFSNDIEVETKPSTGTVIDKVLNPLEDPNFHYYTAPDTILDYTCNYVQVTKEIISMIKPTDDILNEVNSFCNNIDIQNTIAVQVRTWKEAVLLRKQLYNINKYITAIESYNNKKIYLTSDCESVINILKDEYSERAIVYKSDAKHGDRLSVKGMKNILIDFLISSKCSTIIGDKHSAFTQNSWWFNGNIPEMYYV